MLKRIIALVAGCCFLFAVPAQAIAAQSKSTAVPVKKVTRKKVTSRDLGDLRGTARVIRLATLLSGTPYRGGGTTPDGFDCSGFTSYVYKNALAVDLPHSSAAQARKGKAIARKDLLPGDIVYFKTSGSRISHAGIYIGGGKFISSTSSSGVKITSLTGGYWGKRYLGARRIVG